MSEGNKESERPDVRFHEQMSGYLALGQDSFEGAYTKGKAAENEVVLDLTISIVDVDGFISDPQHEGVVTGEISCELLGGRLAITNGSFNLLVDTQGDSNRKKMHYRLHFLDGDQQVRTLTGFKDVHDDVGFDTWSDTTTLNFNILEGNDESSIDTTPNTTLLATGIVKISMQGFVSQLASFRSFADTFSERAACKLKFGTFFLGQLWETHGLSLRFGGDEAFRREIPMFTTEGVINAEQSVNPFTTEDNIGLSLLRFQRKSCNDVVLIIHGLTTSSDMFIMPEHKNLVSYLLENEFTDVWTLDYRMSNRHPYNSTRHRFTMDDIALFDYPAALRKLRSVVGPDVNVHVICHCLGAVSFSMSLFARAVTDIKSVVANSAALTPKVPFWSLIKLWTAPFLSEYLGGMPYLDPNWSHTPGLTLGKAFSKINSMFHRECDVPACHMLSLMWGSGWQALYNHKNLADITHLRGGDLYGPTSVHYYRHVRKMVMSNNTAVKYNRQDSRLDRLPDDYFQYAKEINTPILFMTGQENRVFTDSNVLCYDRLEKLVPGLHSLKVIPGYGHQDVFMGQNCHRDVFPHILDHLNVNR